MTERMTERMTDGQTRKVKIRVAKAERSRTNIQYSLELKGFDSNSNLNESKCAFPALILPVLVRVKQKAVVAFLSKRKKTELLFCLLFIGKHEEKNILIYCCIGCLISRTALSFITNLSPLCFVVIATK